MRRLRTRRPSPALAVALLALLVALGGTATAASIVLVKNSRQVAKGAISLSDLSASAQKALRGKAGPVGPAGPAGLAGAAGAAGSAGATGATGAAGTPATRMFATITLAGGTGNVDRGSGLVALSTPGAGAGVAYVKFNRDISGCTWLATAGSSDSTLAGNAIATTELKSAMEPDTVEVRIRNAAGTSVDEPFHIAVFCP